MGGETLRVYLKMQNLFVRDIPKTVSPAITRATLEKIGGPLCKVVIPLDHNTGQTSHIGQAYLNFSTHEEAQRCLDKYRFKLVFKGETAKVMYAATDKDRVYGPYSYKFQVIVKNLSEEVDVQMLFDYFSQFGEIYQCKTDTDNFSQYYGQVTYLDEDSVAVAVAGANGTRWESSVILVEAHHKAHLAPSAAPPPPPPDTSSLSSYPALGAPSAAANGNGSAAPRPANYSQHLLLQQHQQPQSQEQQEQLFGSGSSLSSTPTPVNFAVQALAESNGNSTPVSSRFPPAPFSGAAGTGLQESATSAPSALDAPVTLPVRSQVGGSSLLGTPAAAVGSSPVAAPAAAPAGPDLPRLSLSEFSRGPTTGPGSARLSGPTSAAAAAAAANGSSTALRLGGSNLLQLLERRRVEAAAAAAAAAAVPGAAAVPAAAINAVSSPLAPARVSTPPVVAVAAAGAGGDRMKGGLLKALAQSVEHISEVLCCPITHEVFADPVVAADGITYERKAITNWLTNHDTSPMTNTQLLNKVLHPNNLVKTLVEELL